MTPVACFARTLLLITAVLLASGCSSVQWNDAGRQLGTSAAGQLFAMAFGGNDGFENLTDDEFEKQRVDYRRFESLTREQLLDSDRTAERWEQYDDIVSSQPVDSVSPGVCHSQAC